MTSSNDAVTPNEPNESESGGILSRAWGWGAALLLAAVLVTFTWQWWTPADWLVEGWRAELEEAPEAEIVTRVQQIAELGDAGIDPLVDALGSPRESVAEAARRELGNQMDQWELLPTAESSAKIAILIKGTHARAAKWPAAPLRLAAELAHRALRWRLDSKSVAVAEIFRGCETVLKASAAANRPLTAPVSLAVFAEDPNGANPRDWQGTASDDEILKHVAFDDPRRPPSAELPLDLFPLPAPPPWPAADAKGTAPPRPNESSDEGPLPITEPALLSPLPGRPVPMDGAAGTGDVVPNQPRATAEAIEFSRQLAIMKSLQSTDPREVAKAEAQLREAGFDELRLEVARRLTSRDPSIRRDLAEQLIRVPGFDARPWLIALTQDSDPSVASIASRVLATSSDPALQSAAREGMKR